MAGDCIYNPHYANDDTFGNKHLLGKKQELARDFNVLDAMKGNASTSVAASSPYFEIIDGVLYRKKLEKGYTNYREVLDKDRRQNAIATFHLKGKGHHTLEDTYRFVAENYWWEGMYFHIREYVLGCQECQAQQERKKAQPELCVSRTLASHGNSVLSKLRGQREAGLFCDITLKTSGRSFPAHKAVLAAVSEYFQEIFAEMDSTSNPQADIDLTGFSEEIFLPLLEFSYTSTLSLRAEDLGEVSTMARHFRMWAAVEACRAIQSEQRIGRGRSGATTNNLRSTNCPPPFSVSPQLANGQQYRPMGAGGVHGKRKRDRSVLEEEPAGPHRKRLPPPATRERITHESLKPSEGVGRPPTRSLTRCLPQGENGLPLSPTRRLKLMDFKSPSSKVKLPPAPRAPSSSAPAAPVSPQAHRQPTRVLRSGTMAPQVRQPKEVGSLERKALKVPALNSTPTPSSTPSSSRCKQRLSFPEAGPGAGLEVSMVKEEPVEEEVQSSSMLEKYRLLSVLGLQRKSLLPDPVQLTGWRQKKRLRKLKVSSYSLTARRKPRLARPVISPGDAGNAAVLPLRPIKVEPPEPVAVEEVRLKRGPRRGRSTSGAVEPQERRELRRSVRIRDAPLLGLPRLRARKAETGSRILRRKHVRVKREPAAFAITPPALPSCSTLGLHQGEHFLSLRARGSIPDSSPPSKSSARVGRRAKYNSTRPGKAAKRDRASVSQRGRCEPGQDVRRAGSYAPLWQETSTALSGIRNNGSCSSSADAHLHTLRMAIKDEPADPVPVTTPIAMTMELGKRRSKPPIKLLDPGFLFDFGGVKREEESVDICLTRSVSQGPGRPRRAALGPGAPQGFDREQPRLRGVVSGPMPKKRVTTRLRGGGGAQGGSHRPCPANSGKPKSVGNLPKKRRQQLPLQSRRLRLLESTRRVRWRQLRGVRGHAPVTSHTCVQCRATYRNCDSLIMHQIRHIEGKHWPCPLCSKTFFRQSNVQNHIRTHDQKLYKCRVCISAA